MGEGTATAERIRRRRIIERPRLTRLLDESQGRIKMLVAPAGYGKTTLARQWLAAKKAVWYTATPASADVAALAAGLKDAVSQVVPGAGDALMERLPVTAQADRESELLGSMFAVDLQAWPPSAWLVLDDYQCVLGHAPAERLIEVLLLDAPLNVLLISRQRPAWASPRRILYGDVVEVTRRELAMTTEEARVLFDDAADNEDVIALTEGWPAVVALVSMSGAAPRDLMAAPNLVSYLADEIFQKLDPPIRRSLCELALYDVQGRQTAIKRLGPQQAERLIRTGVDHGFLDEPTPGQYEMHPLLRSFLELKLREEGQSQVQSTVSRVVRTMFELHLWDESYDVIRRFGEQHLVVDLLGLACVHLLAQGRTSTIRTWISEADPNAPTIQHAASELALREGKYHRAETLALLAARGADNAETEARALIVAGRAAHVASRQQKALEYYARAASIATTAETGWHAKLGDLQAAAELEAPDAPDRLSELAAAAVETPAQRVVLTDRSIGIASRFGLPVNLQAGRAAAQLLPLVGDPMIRTSFRNIFGYALAASGQFDQALRLMSEQLDDAERCRIDFAIPYALVTKALVLTGQREYAAANAVLVEADDLASHADDHTATSVAAAVRARMLIAQGAFEDALIRAPGFGLDSPMSLRAEVESCRALALAGLGHSEEATELARSALTSVGVEATICARATNAVLALREGQHEQGRHEASLALAAATRTGLIESFVCAYRGFPELLVCLLEEKKLHGDVGHLVQLVGDADVLPATAMSPGEHSILQLSPREKEVLGLLARGLTNSEIGKTLFISPSTAKVHVHHILEKLGVKTRTEAAMRAAQLGRQ
jgi:LuxR family transcriptional regulator, maltose regulon positive regulatory protein